MQIDWVQLVPALLLLLTPIAWFHGKRVRYRPVQRDWTGYWGRTIGLGLHAIDLGRAALGAWCLSEAIKAAPGTAGLLRLGPIGVQAAVLCVATAIQTLVCKERDAGHAPFAFVVGLAAGFLPPLIAGFALVLVLVVAFGARWPNAFFPIFSISIAALGYLLTGKKDQFLLGVTAIAVSLPWLLCLLFPRPLVVSYLSKSSSEPHRR